MSDGHMADKQLDQNKSGDQKKTKKKQYTLNSPNVNKDNLLF